VQIQTYEITFLGRANTALRAEFDDCEITLGPGTTTLRAELPDRGALSGLIERINGLGLDVIDVTLAVPPAGPLPDAGDDVQTGARTGQHQRVVDGGGRTVQLQEPAHRSRRAAVATVRLWKQRKAEFLLSITAFAGVALLGVLPGIALAVALSILNVTPCGARSSATGLPARSTRGTSCPPSNPLRRGHCDVRRHPGRRRAGERGHHLRLRGTERLDL
jgi:hypothetical protein